MSTFSTDSPAWQDPPRERQLTGAEARQYEKDMNDWFLRVERADDWPDGDEEESNV